jgi:hypothetical protein
MLLLAALLVMGVTRRSAAQQPPRLRVSGDPGPLNVSTAVAGAQPDAVSAGATTYDVRVNAATVKKITAQLSAPLPPGVTLTVTLAPPTGATSMGAVTLDATVKDVVVNITGVNSTHAITYQLNATTAAGVIPVASRIVTLNLVNYP